MIGYSVNDASDSIGLVRRIALREQEFGRLLWADAVVAAAVFPVGDVMQQRSEAHNLNR